MVILCLFLLLACLYDYRKRRIPNGLVAATWLTGMGSTIHEQGMWGGGFFLLRMGIVLFLLYPLFRIGVLGAGDVKLLGVCAGYFPFRKIWIFLFCSLLIAAMISLVKMIKGRNIRERFVYLGKYIAGVCREGRWYLYIENEKEKVAASVCLAGPMLCSALMCLGGMY